MLKHELLPSHRHIYSRFLLFRQIFLELITERWEKVEEGGNGRKSKASFMVLDLELPLKGTLLFASDVS